MQSDASAVTLLLLQFFFFKTQMVLKNNKAFFNFLWNGKGDKIKRDIMIGDYSQGGLSINKAIKIYVGH